MKSETTAKPRALRSSNVLRWGRGKSLTGCPHEETHSHRASRRWFHKKGQMEMVGLVVIVILITLGMLFMAQFALKSDNQKKIFTRKGLAYSTTSALMKTTVQAEGCNGLELGADILEDCVENWQSPDFQLTCGRARLASCEFFDNLITHLLEETLGTWNKNYEFRVRLVEMAGEEPEELITIPNENGGGCSKKERDSSGLFPLHIGSGLIESELFICD